MVARTPSLLSARTKVAFQAISVFATVAVIGIHYRSAVPQLANPLEVTWNALAQEFLLGGISRVAVPLFAFAAGLFYFFSCDGSLTSHVTKWRSRVTTLVAPYLISGGIALAASFAIRHLEGRPNEPGIARLLVDWWIRPPAEQLWFLRDLILLTLLAPLVGWLVNRAGMALVSALGVLWIANIQPFPILHGWYLVNIETLLFYCLGAYLAGRPEWIESLTHARASTTRGLVVIWSLVVAARVWIQPNFDAWYVTDYTLRSLVLHQVSIVVGVVACIAIAGHVSSSAWAKLSGLSFFVYLVHEFPLRAVVARGVESTSLGANSFWVTAPLVTAACFVAGWWLSRWTPTWFNVLTGGRTPTRALKLRSTPSTRTAPLGATH